MTGAVALAFDWALGTPNACSASPSWRASSSRWRGRNLSPQARERLGNDPHPWRRRKPLGARTEPFSAHRLRRAAESSPPVSDDDMEAYLEPFPPPRRARRPPSSALGPRPDTAFGGETRRTRRPHPRHSNAWLESSTSVPKLLLTFEGAAVPYSSANEMVEWCATHIALA